MTGADPYDEELSKMEDNTARPFLRGPQGLPAEASNYVDEPISLFEETHQVPFTAVRLGYSEKMNIDPQVDLKIHAIDEFIRQQMQEEGLRDSKVGYNTIFERMAKSLGESPESAKNSNTSKKLLDNLFMQVSISHRLSSKTYLEQFTKRFEEQRVVKLLAQLKTTLQGLKQ